MKPEIKLPPMPGRTRDAGTPKPKKLEAPKAPPKKTTAPKATEPAPPGVGGVAALIALLLFLCSFGAMAQSTTTPGRVDTSSTSGFYTNRLLWNFAASTSSNRVYFTNTSRAFGDTNLTQFNVRSNATTGRWEWRYGVTAIATNTGNRPSGTWRSNTVANGIAGYTRYEPTTIFGLKLDALNRITEPTNFFSANADLIPSGTVGTVYVVANGATNALGYLLATTNAPNLYGPVRVAMPTGTYGANSDAISIGDNRTNSMDAFANTWRHLMPVGGIDFRDPASDKSVVRFLPTIAPSQDTGYNIQGGGILQVDGSGYGRQPAGAGVTAYLNNLGGDAAGLRSLPIRGPEIWNRLKFPFVHIVGWYDGGGLTTLWAATNITSQMVTNMVSANVANGLLQAFTNRGIPVFNQIDAVWMGTNRNASGDIVVNSNQFPGGIEAPIAHSQAAGFKVQLGYYWHNQPTNHFTVDPAGNQGAYPKYQTMTSQTVNNDILQAFNWGVNAIRMANTVPWYDTSGYQNQMVRQVADAVLNPNGFPWRRNYGTNPMVLNVLLGDNGYNGFSETPLLSANYVEADSEIHSLRSDKTELSDIYTNALYLYERTARLCGKGHYATAYVVSDPGVPTPSMTTNQWRTDLSFGAMWGSGIQFNTNQAAWQIAQVTNSYLMDIYFDTESHPAWLFMRNGDQQLGAVKPLAGGAYAIWLFNDSATNHTWALNLTNLFLPPGDWSPIQRPPMPPTAQTLWRFTDVWQRTNYGYFDNFSNDRVATVTLPPTNSTLIFCKPVWFQDVSFASASMGYTFIHYPGDAVSGTGIFDGEFGAAFTSTPQSTWATPKLPNYTTLATIKLRYYAGATQSYWTNTISPQYIGGNTRFWNSGGVSQSDVYITGSSTGMSNLTITASFPVTNATKWVTIYNGVATNSAIRFFCDPFRVIAE